MPYSIIANSTILPKGTGRCNSSERCRISQGRCGISLIYISSHINFSEKGGLGGLERRISLGRCRISSESCRVSQGRCGISPQVSQSSLYIPPKPPGRWAYFAISPPFPNRIETEPAGKIPGKFKQYFS
jgi:hypothetical protein